MINVTDKVLAQPNDYDPSLERRIQQGHSILTLSLAEPSEKTSPKKILCYINHYFGKTSAFVGKSTVGDSLARRQIVHAVIARLRSLPGEVDIRVCGFPEASLVPIDIDLSVIGEPRHIVYESIERMFAAVDDYDWFVNIEDDIFLHDDLFANAIAFTAISEINEVWLPNRMEERADGTLSSVDLEAIPGWTGLERQFMGETLAVAHNCHSGMFLLSREQMRYASTRVSLKRREEFFGGLMASAYANVHAPFLLWRAKSAPLAHHIIHADKWLFSAESLSAKRSELEKYHEAPAVLSPAAGDVSLELGLRAEIACKDAEVYALRGETGRLVEKQNELIVAHEKLLRSTSWRLTAPLRSLGNTLPWLRTPLRRAARLAWWTVTLQVARRLADRRAALAAAAQPLAAPAGVEAPPAVPEDPAFDRYWYLAAYPDVAAAGIDPFEYYTANGKGEGRHPTQAAAEEALGFDRSWYLAAYSDVAASGQDPFQHWMHYGKAEGRHFNACFSFSHRQLAVLAKSYHYKDHEAASSVERAPKALPPTPLTPTFDSARYWRDRYRAGGNSGAGSYGRLADFKAKIVNTFVREHTIASVIEFGCGDGAQLTLADYPSYLGFDIADGSIELCRSKFERDATRKFRNTSTWDYESAHLTLSLDVIFHLVEDHVFHEYMRRLFASAERYVIVYSSNYEGEQPAAHVKHRRFTDWVNVYHADFKLIRHVPNRYPLIDDDQTESFASFFIFEKQISRKHTLPGHLVVSLTSYPMRFPTLELTLRRILQQSVHPDETVLWVSPEDCQQIPEGVLALRRSGLIVRETRDIRSYKKIVPSLEHYPDSFIITLDDDTAYPLDTIEPLVANYRSPNEILCRRAHHVTFDGNGDSKPYGQWQFETPREISSDLFATGVGGVLYPPRCLAPEVLDEATFTALAPLADDIWLFWMERLAGCTIRRVGPRDALQPWPGCHEQGLWVNHNADGGNDIVIAALTARYGLPLTQSRSTEVIANGNVFMPIALDEVHAKFPSDHCRQVTAEYYIDALPDVPTRFIDIGAGDGRSFDIAKRKLTKLDWVGIDIEGSPEVRMRTRQDCKFISYDGVNIPFPDNSFDVAYSRQVFEHVRYPEQLLKEIYRILKPGGLFIGSVSQLEPYHSYSFWNFTYYGFAVICSDAGLKLDEYRPGIDGFTLCARHALLFWLRQNIRDFFTPLFEKNSPANSYIESICRSNNSETLKINLDKVTYCGHLCFKFSK